MCMESGERVRKNRVSIVEIKDRVFPDKDYLYDRTLFEVLRHI